MPDVSPCPDRQTLEQFLLGRISGAQADGLEEHFTACGRCLEAVRALETEDLLVSKVRAGAKAGGIPAAEVDEALMARLCRLSRGDGPSRPDTAADSLLQKCFNDAPAPLESMPASESKPETFDFLAPPQEPGEIGRLGPYQVLKELGRGGMGIVFQARQTRPQRLVALKMILVAAPPGSGRLARFRSEAEVVARLQHPNIVQIFEIGEHAGRPYYAMELVDGPSLAQELAKRPLPAQVAAQLVQTLARAVQHAHERGVIHRDLKPANVLLVSGGAGSGGAGSGQEAAGKTPSAPRTTHHSALTNPKIVDFGLAKLLQEDPAAPQPDYRTESGAIVGTPNYMAPEQALGRSKEIGPAADIYALGAILYEALTGRPPFKAATVFETLEQVCTQEPVPPGRLQPGLPRDLQTICLKCLAKDPARRYASALALGEDLQRFQEGRPIRARPVRLGERAWKWCRRRPVVAVLSCCTLLLAAALIAVGLVYHFRLQDALDTSESHRVRAESNYKKMIEAADGLLSEVGDKDLAGVPEMEPVRIRLLKKALRFYEGLLHDKDNPDPAIRRETAHALWSTAAINRDLGRLDRAETDVKQALALCEQLSRDFPDEVIYRSEWAHALAVQFFIYYDMGRPGEAVAVGRRGKSLRESLPLEQPEHRLELASTCKMLALKCNDEEEARKLYQQALDLLEQPHPGGQAAGAAFELAGIYLNLGWLNHTTGHPRAAEAAYLKGLQFGNKAVAEVRAVGAAQAELAKLYHNLAALAQDRKSLTKAENLYLKALPLRQAVVNQHPLIPRYALDLVVTLEGLARLYCDMRAPAWASAEPCLREAVAIRLRYAGRGYGNFFSGSALAREYTMLGQICAQTKRPLEAEAEFHKAVNVLGPPGANKSKRRSDAVALGEALMFLGHLQAQNKKAKEAVATLSRAIDLLGPILRKEQSSVTVRAVLRAAYGARAEAYNALGQTLNAVADLYQFKVLEKPPQPRPTKGVRKKRGMGNRNRVGGTQALAHPPIPVQVRIGGSTP